MNPRSLKGDPAIKGTTKKSEFKFQQIIVWMTDKPPQDTRTVMVDNGRTIDKACFDDGEWRDEYGDAYLKLVFRWADLPESCRKAVTPDWANL